MTDPVLQARPRQGAGIHMVRLGPEAVLCDGEGRHRCSLNSTAAALWELCDGDTTVQEIVDAVAIVSSEEHEMLQSGIERALAELSATGLIEWRP